MLFFNVRRMLETRGIENPYTFLVKNGFVSQTASNLSRNQIKHIKPEQIEKLCLLLNCTPNDLFEWQTETDAPTPENHPLKSLVRDKNATPAAQLLKSIPAEKLAQAEELLRQLKDG